MDRLRVNLLRNLRQFPHVLTPRPPSLRQCRSRDRTLALRIRVSGLPLRVPRLDGCAEHRDRYHFGFSLRFTRRIPPTFASRFSGTRIVTSWLDSRSERSVVKAMRSATVTTRMPQQFATLPVPRNSQHAKTPAP